MTEKSDLSFEFEKSYEFVGDIKRTLEGLTSSMYDFRGRIEKIHKNLCMIQSESVPRLPANVDWELNHKLIDNTCDCDYLSGLVKAEVNWPVHMLDSFLPDKCSGLLGNLQKTYNDLLERKQRYGAKLFVMYNAYIRSLGHIKQQNKHLQDLMVIDNVHPGLVRWVQKDLCRAQAAVEIQQRKLTKYMEHKQSDRSKFFQRMQSLEEQLCHIEEICVDQIQSIMTETITNYAYILKYGRPQQQQLASESLCKKLHNMDPNNKTGKWLESNIGLLYITSDLNLELMTLNDEEACSASSKIEIVEVAPADTHTSNISDESDMVSGDHGDHNETLDKSEISDVIINEPCATSDCSTTWVRFDGDQLPPIPASASSVSWPGMQTKNDEQTVSNANDVIGFDDNFVPRNTGTLSHLKVRVTSSYEKCDKPHMTLRPGMIIHQKHPANAEGLCYGYKRTRLGLKRHGMYPAHCIEQVHVDQ